MTVSDKGELPSRDPRKKSSYHIIKQFQAANNEKEYTGNHDELTGLYNRHFLDKELTTICQSLDSYTVFMFDADNFKAINDSLGHKVGDEVLKKIAETIMNNSRSSDYQVRFGGDEFILVLPNVYDENLVTQIALRLNTAFQDNDLHVSFGMATAFKDPSLPNLTLADTIHQADLNLLEMKKYKVQY